MDNVLRVTDVAEIVGYPESTVNRWCRTGKLPATKHGHHWFIRRQDLDAMFDPFAPRPTPALSPLVDGDPLPASAGGRGVNS